METKLIAGRKSNTGDKAGAGYQELEYNNLLLCFYMKAGLFVPECLKEKYVFSFASVGGEKSGQGQLQSSV